MSVFPHMCSITAPAAYTGGIDAYGQPTGTVDADAVVYAGRCRLIEGGRAVQAERLIRDEGGSISAGGVSILRLPYGSGPFNLETNVVEVTANGLTRAARILRASYPRRRVILFITWKELAV